MGYYLFPSTPACYALTLHIKTCVKEMLTIARAALQPGMIFTSLFRPIHQAKSGGKHNARIPPKGTHLLGKGEKRRRSIQKGHPTLAEEAPPEMVPKSKCTLIKSKAPDPMLGTPILSAERAAVI
jgi:hypothetical protein